MARIPDYVQVVTTPKGATRYQVWIEAGKAAASASSRSAGSPSCRMRSMRTTPHGATGPACAGVGSVLFMAGSSACCHADDARGADGTGRRYGTHFPVDSASTSTSADQVEPSSATAAAGMSADTVLPSVCGGIVRLSCGATVGWKT